MSKRPFFCGKCNRSFGKSSKYCPRCGSLLSIPVHESPFRESLAYVYEFTDRAWRLIALFMLFLGAMSFMGVMLYRMSEIGPPLYQPKSQESAPPAGNNTLVEVKTGQLVICDPCGAVIEDRTYSLRVKLSDAEKYETTELHTSDCDICPTAQDDPPGKQQPDEAQLKPGMAKDLVVALWGMPARREYFIRDYRRVERWYFSDPVLGINSSSRYVEFNDHGEVTYIHEMENLKEK